MKEFKRILAFILSLIFILAIFGSLLSFAEESTKLIIHYKPIDDKEWNIWAWPKGAEGKVYEFTSEDEFGKVCTVEIPGKHDIVGFIVRTDKWEKYGGDRMVEIKNGQGEVWVIDENDYSTVIPSKMKPEISRVDITGFKELKIRFNMPYDEKVLNKNEIKLNEGKVEFVDKGLDDRTIFVKTVSNIDITKVNEVEVNGYGRAKASVEALVRTKEFDEEYYYDGPLGALYSKEKTNIYLWAPTALKVDLNIYDSYKDQSNLKESLAMKRGEKGSWNIELPGDKKDLVYDYTLTFPNGEKVNSQDPYSKAVTVNGDRSVILAPEDTKIDNFNRIQSFSKNTDAIIYEVHVRDFSIGEDSGMKNKGKFLAFTEEGTKNKMGSSTGLDYLKSLGITHVQLLPIYDYASVNELKNDEYNWGYDPKNYNVPEGSYATDPINPVNRIKELKETIKVLHDNNLRVIMDVVYNHVFDVNSSAFHKTVPGYYFRYDKNGELMNGTGVGNDVASERKMARRFIIDSALYWVKEYNLDGFRFDLMGIHDIETMKLIREKINEIDPSFIILGEGWDLNTGLLQKDKSIQKNASQLKNIAFFNDSIRDAIKGSVFENSDKGFISGEKYQDYILAVNLLGSGDLPSAIATYEEPGQVIQYAEAHDNLTMYDKLLVCDKKDDEKTRSKKHRLGTSLVLLAQGVPFIHGGQEFLRTKFGDHNSYKSGDEVNKYDWSKIDSEKESLDYFKGLVALRKSSDLFRLTSYEDIKKSASILNSKDNLIVIKLFNERESFYLIFNGSHMEREVAIEDGNYDLLANGDRVDLNAIEEIKGSKVKLPAFSVYVLKKK